MPSPPRHLPTTFFAGVCGLLMLLAQGCQAPQRTLTPKSIQASTVSTSDQKAVMQRWQLAIDLANEFLASPFNKTLPRDARLQLDADGMQFGNAERTIPVTVVIIDDYRTSSCVCATIDTYKKVVYAYRPWGAELDLPIESCNTFFETPVGFDDANLGLATHVLRMATVLYFEKHTHISTWEWFKCQWLEWLIGSGHHKFSMRRTNAVTKEVFYFWNGMEPATPAMKRILAGQAKSRAESERKLAERSRGTASWRKQFDAYLRERDGAADVAGEHSPTTSRDG